MDPLKILEKQSGFLRLLVYLTDHNEKTITEIMHDTDISVHQLYSSIDKARELGLINTNIDRTRYPARNMISLTGKGSKVAEKIKEITTLLVENEH